MNLDVVIKFLQQSLTRFCVPAHRGDAGFHAPILDQLRLDSGVRSLEIVDQLSQSRSGHFDLPVASREL